MNEMTLREVCSTYGVSRRAIQGYEAHGLVTPTGKTDRGYLLYDEQTQRKIVRIKTLQAYGFSLKEIQQYRNLKPTQKVKCLLGKLDILEEKHQELTETIHKIQSDIRKLSS